MEKFKEDEWFGFEKFWLKNNRIVSRAINGMIEFDMHLVVTEAVMKEHLRCDLETIRQDNLIGLYNYTAMMLIDHHEWEMAMRNGLY